MCWAASSLPLSGARGRWQVKLCLGKMMMMSSGDLLCSLCTCQILAADFGIKCAHIMWSPEFMAFLCVICAVYGFDQLSVLLLAPMLCR
jgi:hypothetical protein